MLWLNFVWRRNGLLNKWKRVRLITYLCHESAVVFFIKGGRCNQHWRRHACLIAAYDSLAGSHYISTFFRSSDIACLSTLFIHSMLIGQTSIPRAARTTLKKIQTCTSLTESERGRRAPRFRKRRGTMDLGLVASAPSSVMVFI